MCCKRPEGSRGGNEKKEVCEAMPPCQHAVHDLAIETVERGLLSRLKCAVSPDNGSRRQQSLQQDVGAEVHVMVAVDATRVGAVKPPEFIELCRYDILK